MLTFTFIHNGTEKFTVKAESFDAVRALKSGTKNDALEDIIFPIRKGNKPSPKRFLAYVAQTDFLPLMESARHTQGTLHIASSKVQQGIAMSCRQCYSKP
jgi:hypothetical protein